MNKIIFTLTVIAIFFITSCSNSTQKKSEENKDNFKSPKASFTTKEVTELVKGDVLLVDVRDPEELIEQSYDVKNIINIPLDSIETKINSIPKNKQVVLVCQGGKRSKEAYDILVKKGFTNLANMEGGMNDWSDAGLPTKSGVVANAANIKLEVYAFHGTRQCETCKNMKANTKATLEKYFAAELKAGKIVYQIIDVDDAKNEKLAEKFQATGTALMINKVVNGKDNITDWSDFAFDKANDSNTFIPELKTKIETVLK